VDQHGHAGRDEPRPRLKVHLPNLEAGGMLIVNEAHFKQGDPTRRRGWDLKNPAQPTAPSTTTVVIKVDFEHLVGKAVEGPACRRRTPAACKNFYALGWSSGSTRGTPGARSWPSGSGSRRVRRWRKRTSGPSRPATTTARPSRRWPPYAIQPARLKPGKYRNVTGNSALALGLIRRHPAGRTAALLRQLPDHSGSDILHELSKHRRFHVTTFQAEDEIAAISAAIGASFSGALGITGSMRPRHRAEDGSDGSGRDDRAALVIVNVQRGGPSTGLPTKTEQS